MIIPRERFTLHWSVLTRLWLTDLPQSDVAKRFFDERLVAGNIEVFGIHTIRTLVLGLVAGNIAADLTPPRLDPALGEKICGDILELFSQLVSRGTLRLVDATLFEHGAFAIASFHQVSFWDCLAVMLARVSRTPLLIADQDLRCALRPIERIVPDLRVLWLPEFVGQ